MAMAEFAPTIPVELTHPSGLVFNLHFTDEQIEKFRSEPNYADEVLQKYYSLYESGLVTAVKSPEVSIDAQSRTEPPEVVSARSQFKPEDEELLIQLVAERPPLYDFRLPLKERGREEVRKLWEEVIEQLNVDITVEQISKKWKNIRDSFIRVRGNIKTKIASGSSAEAKVMAEKLRRGHKNFDLLMFLEDTLSSKRTSSNLYDSLMDDDSRASMSLQDTPSTSRSSSKLSHVEPLLNDQDKLFIDTIKTLPVAQHFTPTPTQSFCLRLAGGLDKLPPRVSNQLQVEFLTRLTEMENLHAYRE